MKDKLKNTLEHEVEILGRSVSVLLLAGLLVAGGASAALLNSFGTVSGEADVDQSVLVDDQALNSNSDSVNIFDATGDDSIVAGESVTGQVPIENQASEPVSVDFTTTGTYSEDGVTYEYALLDTFAYANNTEDTSNSAETEIVRRGESFAVRAQADIDSVNDNGEITSAIAGVFFDVNPDPAVSPEDAEVTVDYSVGDADTNPADVDPQGPDWLTVEFETDSGETYTAIDPQAYTSGDSGTVAISDSASVVDDGDDSSTVLDYSGAEITGIGVSTGSVYSAPDDETFELIYEEVTFEETDLISDRTYTPTSSATSIDLQAETDYDFAGHLGTTVYTDPSSTYSANTELVTGQ